MPEEVICISYLHWDFIVSEGTFLKEKLLFHWGWGEGWGWGTMSPKQWLGTETSGAGKHLTSPGLLIVSVTECGQAPGNHSGPGRGALGRSLRPVGLTFHQGVPGAGGSPSQLHCYGLIPLVKQTSGNECCCKKKIPWQTLPRSICERQFGDFFFYRLCFCCCD